MHEPIPALAVPSPASPVTFTGERSEFTRLSVRGGLLEFITLGFYRFWLATDIRRHLWSNTLIDGDPLEYTGRARELLIGFLIAIAILIPVYLAYFLAGLEAELIQAFASIPLVLFLYLFSQFAMYRARRYRMTRTIWRGLRFSMGGSGWSYSWRAGLWTLLVGLTCGAALPWREAALERFKMRHTSYGSLQGQFVGTGGSFFKSAWHLWLLAPFAFLFVIPAPFLYGAFKAIEWRWRVSGTRFGDVRLESGLETGALIGCYWKVIGWYSLFSLLMLVWFVVVGFAGAAIIGPDLTADERTAAVLQHPAVLIGMVVGYLMMGVALGVVARIYLTRGIWAKIAGTTMVHNLAAADDVTGQGIAADALGEGLGDSFDIGGF
jgi:uncharacterized membrane protein YjgN (DUF898 family)